MTQQVANKHAFKLAYADLKNNGSLSSITDK